jgi:putative endonuclease
VPQGHKKTFGAEGESAACIFLENHGFEIINKNFIAGRTGEIDIIVLKDNLIVFVEVKARNTDNFGGGIYSITRSKIKKLKGSAKVFLLENPMYNSKEYLMRFDLIIFKDGSIQWIEDIAR